MGLENSHGPGRTLLWKPLPPSLHLRCSHQPWPPVQSSLYWLCRKTDCGVIQTRARDDTCFWELGSLPNRQTGLLNLCPWWASLPRDSEATLQQEVLCPNGHFLCRTAHRAPWPATEPFGHVVCRAEDGASGQPVIQLPGVEEAGAALSGMQIWLKT